MLTPGDVLPGALVSVFAITTHRFRTVDNETREGAQSTFVVPAYYSPAGELVDMGNTP